MLTKRSIPLTIIFSFLTFGIYAIYWYIKFHSEVRQASGQGASTVLHVLGLLFTFGIYPIIWVYFASKRLASIGAQDQSTLNLILGVAGLFTGITLYVAWCLMQNEANGLVDRGSQPTQQPFQPQQPEHQEF
ncbi:MAG: DUF4234 domain-containing protein [Firmicutes bacterium]|nr:DUF4234 domain-containing protein [Bacillota bacterium]